MDDQMYQKEKIHYQIVSNLASKRKHQVKTRSHHLKVLKKSNEDLKAHSKKNMLINVKYIPKG